MPTECSAEQFEFEGLGRRRVVAAFDGGAVSSDGGALLLRHADRALGLIDRVATCFVDRREQDQVVHSLPALVGQRIVGIALGYEDISDHDELRHDPVLALFAQRLEPKRRTVRRSRARARSIAWSTRHSGLTTATTRSPTTQRALADLFVDLFLDAHRRRPKRIVLDLDATDDPLHGAQEGRFFHGYYNCYCYLPLYVFCGRYLLAAVLRPSNIDAAAGAIDEVERIVARIRARWPRVQILLRADSGFAREELMAWCETNGVDDVFGLARNPRLVADLEGDLARAAAEHAKTDRPARRFKEFRYATLDSWSRDRRVVGKAEHLAKGANPRFIVTSLGARGDRGLDLVRAGLLRPRRDGEPDQGAAARPVRRPYLRGHHAGQSAAPVVRVLRLRPARGAPPHRLAPHSVPGCHLWHEPAQAA